MRLITSLLVIGCIVSFACGQWVEKTIGLPDSLSVLGSPGTMVYNTGNNFLFVGCDTGVAIVDGFSNQLIARTSIPNLRDGVACYAPQVNRLYWLGGSSGSTTFVLDGATGQDLKHIATPNASDVCYNPVVNRVYVSTYDTSGYLMVIDAVKYSVTRILRLGTGYEASVVCDPADNKVYVLSYLDGAVFVIDCDMDSIIDTIAVGSTPGQLVYNRVDNKLYCCSWDASVTIIDCHSDTVLARIVLPGGIEAAAYNPVANKLYCDDGEGICVISGQGDSLLGRVLLPGSPTAIVCDSTDNLMWCSLYSDTIYAIDGQGDSLYGTVAVGSAPHLMCYNPTRNRLYLRDAHLTVVDPVERKTDKRILLGFHPAAVCWAESSSKLYCAGRDEATVAVVGSTNSVERLIPVGRDPSALAYDRPLGVICCANNRDSTVSIIACNGDSVTATVRVGSQPQLLCVDTILHKAWCSISGAVAVIDLQAESLTAVISVPVPKITTLFADPARSRVYCATGYDAHVVVLDAVGDSIVASVPVGGYAQDLSLNPGADVVYCLTSNNEAVAVIDAAALRVVKIVPVGGYPQVLLYNERRNKLYCANWSDNTLTVIDGSTQEPLATVDLTTWPWAMAYDSDADALHCLDNSNGYVAILDCRRDSMIKTVRVGTQPVAAAYGSAFRRMYVANQYGSSLSVIRDTAQAIEEGPPQAANFKPQATVIRGVMVLPGLGTRSESPERNSVMSCTALLDISGRKVLDLKPGANDVRALAPGVYFVRRASSAKRDTSGVTKVVITR